MESVEALALSGVGLEPVHHDLDRVLALLVEGGGRFEFHPRAVDARAQESLALELGQLGAVLPLPPPHDGSEDLRALAGGGGEQAVGHLLHGLPADGTVALRAELAADAREEQPEVVVDLGGGGHGGARVAGGGALLDRDGRREPVDVVDVRLLHLAEELARVGGEALHVAPLPLGVDGVEGQARLARAAHPGDHHQPVAGDLQGDVLEVVLAGSANGDGGHGCDRGRGRESRAVEARPRPRRCQGSPTAR